MRWGAGERRCAADGPAAQSIGKPKTVAAKPKALRAAHSPKALRAAHKPNALCAAHRTEAGCASKAVKLKSAERCKHLTSAERCKKTPRVQSVVRCNDCAGALPFRSTNENGLSCQTGNNAKLEPGNVHTHTSTNQNQAFGALTQKHKTVYCFVNMNHWFEFKLP